MSDLGINPSNDGKVIRLVFPELTEERRKELTKDVKKKGEDSKICLLYTSVMEMVRMGKLTIDEARVHPKRNMITRAVGIEETIPADTVICTLEDDSIVLVCSDGLSTMITDDEIEKILKKKTDIGKKADLLVELANKNGGYDNISVILADRRVDN